MALGKYLILRKLRSSCLEGRTAAGPILSQALSVATDQQSALSCVSQKTNELQEILAYDPFFGALVLYLSQNNQRVGIGRREGETTDGYGRRNWTGKAADFRAACTPRCRADKAGRPAQ